MAEAEIPDIPDFLNARKRAHVGKCMAEIALLLLGEPDSRPSKHEWRYGTHGSLSIRLDKGAWYDHETGLGGGVMELLRRGGHDPVRWLRAHRFWPDSDGRNTARRLVAAYDYTEEQGRLRSRPLEWCSSVEQVASERAPRSAVASERLAAVIANPGRVWSLNQATEPRTDDDR